MFKNIYHYIDLEIGKVDYVFIFIDIDMVILEIREHVYKYNIQEDIEKHQSLCFHRSQCF